GATNTKLYNYNFQYNQLLKTGTGFQVAFNNSRTDTNRRFTSINPTFDSSLFASLTQPILRGFGKAATLAPLHSAEAARIASDYRLNQRVMDVVLLVDQAYWDLVFARKNLDVVKQSLANAQDLYNNNKKQVEVGTMAPLEVVVAQAEVAAREEDI